MGTKSGNDAQGGSDELAGMARVAVHEPCIIAALKSAAGMETGLSVAELSAKCTCSKQQVYKVLRKLGENARIVGRGKTGAGLYSWVDVVVDVTDRAGMEGAGMDWQLDMTLRVVSLRRTSTGLVAIRLLDEEHGRVVEIVTDPSS